MEIDKMDKRICHMTSVHTSRDVRIFYKECTSLASAGYSVYLVAPGDSRFENNVHVIGIGEKPKARLKRMFVLSKKAYKVAVSLDCDVYHIHDPELIPYGVKLLKRGKRVIFDCHEDIFSYIKDKKWIPRIVRGIVSSVSRKYFERVLPLYSSLIAVTPHLYDQLLQLNDKSYMVTNYPIIEERSVSKGLEEYSSFELIYAGGVVPNWGHTEIVESIQRIDGAKYRVYGVAQSGYINALKQLDGENRFEYLGVIPFQDVAEQLSKASVGMAVLKYSNNTAWKRGTLGNTKLFEYFSAGLPVICTDFDLWEEIISKYNCGICINPDSVDEISCAIEFLKNHRIEAQTMGLNARRAIEQEYNWKYQEKILLNLYESIFA